jgi:hypothetical protein
VAGFSARRPLVFLGPTLTAEEAEHVLPATYVPPASQGSIILGVQRHSPSAILLIDGVFQGEPAVRHKEILWAISRGVPVFGAASMGAIRAAELCRHGMVGVGLIFRWYRRFTLLSDDAVAVLHGPAELGSRAVTHSLVDLQRTARRAEREGLFDKATRIRLVSAAAALNFRDRTLSSMVDQAATDRLDRSARAKLKEMLSGCFVAQKKIDAVSALRLLIHLEEEQRLPARPKSEFVTTTAFLLDMRHTGIDPT